ncbi:MAG: C1 family peptidase [Flammeovirgaceae bacterium]
MRIHYQSVLASLVLLTLLNNTTFAQYKFTVIVQNEATPVKNQDQTGTCWSFATASFLESELIRQGKGKHDLSEMFVVRKVYKEKAANYLAKKGKAVFSQGSLSHDLIDAIGQYGIVPETVYTGMQEGERWHDHSELEVSLKGLLDGLAKKENVSYRWKQIYDTILDTYMGQAPEAFTYQGKTYTPQSFAKELNIQTEDYISITSFAHHDFYETFVLDLPDNFAGGYYYNLPLDEFQSAIDHALQNGYTVSWDADVTEDGFCTYNGVAVIPENPNAKHLFKKPIKEVTVTQELRQAQFESEETTDDHLMHITGMAKDQQGNTYYIVKNSWGEKSGKDGYMYVSAAYLRLKSISVMMHKDALPMMVSDKLSFNIQGRK